MQQTNDNVISRIANNSTLIDTNNKKLPEYFPNIFVSLYRTLKVEIILDQLYIYPTSKPACFNYIK